MKDCKKALLKDFKEQFQRKVRESLYQETDKAAKEFLSSILKKHMTKFQKQAIEHAEVKFFGRNPKPDEDES